MTSEKPVGYEFKHLNCAVDEVQAIISQHQLFFWEVVGTNTIVSKESHLEAGNIFLESDTIYSVTTTERFSTIDFRRAKDIPGLSEIRSVESQYFSIVGQLENLGSSALDNYATPPPMKFNWIAFLLLCMFYVIPGVLYWRSKTKGHARIRDEWARLKAEFDALVNDNRDLLNV